MKQVGGTYPKEGGAVEAGEGLAAAGPVAGLVLGSGVDRDGIARGTGSSFHASLSLSRRNGERSRTSPSSRDIEVGDWCAVDGKSLHVETRRKRAIEEAETGNCNSKLLFLAHLRGETGACLAIGGGVVLYMCQEMSVAGRGGLALTSG